MFFNASNSKKRGDIGVGFAIAWASAQGFTISIPLSDSQDYDVVIDDGSRLLRVQVKTVSAKARSGFYIANMRVSEGNRSGRNVVKKLDISKIDALFILAENGDQYFIPVFHGMPSNCITLNAEYDVFRVFKASVA